MLTVLSMFSPCTQWVFGPLSPVSGFEEWEAWNETSKNNSGYSKGIKDEGETHRSTHPPLWRQQVTLLSKLLRTVQQITQLLLNLLLLFLFLFLVCAPPVPSTPETSSPKMIVKSSPDDGGPLLSDSHRPTPPSQSNESPPTDPRTRETRTSPPRDQDTGGEG